MNLTYKRATVEDINILVETRIEVLRAANKLCSDTDMSEVKRQSYSYYQKALCDGSHIAYLIFNDSCWCEGYFLPEQFRLVDIIPEFFCVFLQSIQVHLPIYPHKFLRLFENVVLPAKYLQ